MATDMTLAIIVLSVCLWMIVIHVQSPVELLFQTTIGENDKIMIRPDNNNNNNNLYTNLYQESSLDLVPMKCKATKAITSKSMKEEKSIGIINFLQFPNEIVQISGQINNVTKHDFSNFYFEIETSDDESDNIIIKDDKLFIKREDRIMYFIFNTRLFSIDNKCNINQKRMRKNVIGKNFIVYIKEND
ncbi:hypothetical protein C1645_792516 [Glomus cerebriforme]|uniref:Uncharacterized protein n=1 Tax=Glomus cerebriforme TaxID=658196 RepID=A0A397S700_9GLOM|nr:hypothetical protein C1645_792516 [Glomus cerebriforme]